MKVQNNYIDPDTFKKILSAIPRLKIRKWLDNDILMLFKIAYWCGLRMSEAIILSVEDFDLEMHDVHLGKTKTHKNDKASIPPSFLFELADYLKDRKGPLYPGLKYQTVYIWMIRLGQMLEIPALTTPQSETGEKTKTHIFRKSIAKDMFYGTYGQPAPLNIVSKKLRHSGKNALQQTSEYLKVDLEDVKLWERTEHVNVISKKANTSTQNNDTWQKPFD